MPLASTAIWLDATDGATISTSGGGVTTWANKGALGTSGDFTAPAGNEPSLAFESSMNGNQVIRLDALTAPGNDQLNNSLVFANNVTVAYIGRLAGTANQRLVSANGNNWLLGTWGGNQQSAFFNNGFLYNAGAPDGAARFFVGTIGADGTSAFYSNGTLLGTGTGGVGPSGLRIGGGYLASGTELSSGDVGEFFVFNGVLTTDERTALTNYISRKWLGVGATNVLPSTTALSLTSSASKIDLNGVSQTVGSLSGVASSEVQLNSGSLIVGSDDTSTTFSGIISGAGFFKKIGTGTLTLTGANTYTAPTEISGGTLLTGAANVLPGSSAFTLSGGTLATGGFSQTVGSLSLMSNSMIDFGVGTSVLTFGDIESWSGVLSVWNWSGSLSTAGGTDRLVFENNSLGLDLSTVQFYSDNGVTKVGTGAAFIGTELVPVPESSSIFYLTIMIAASFRRCRALRQR
jgi:autotransporter-associated beta strand protein